MIDWIDKSWEIVWRCTMTNSQWWSLMKSGRVFQARGPATANARSPSVVCRVTGTSRADEDDDRSQRCEVTCKYTHTHTHTHADYIISLERLAKRAWTIHTWLATLAISACCLSSLSIARSSSTSRCSHSNSFDSKSWHTHSSHAGEETSKLKLIHQTRTECRHGLLMQISN